jgi:beta-lactamase regulating signal transducer with metallopeptidase domain
MSAMGGWWLHTALGGGGLLLLTWILAACVRQPARRQWLIESGVGAALILGMMALAPAWILVPVFHEQTTATEPSSAPPVPDAITAPDTDPPRTQTLPGPFLPFAGEGVKETPTANIIPDDETPASAEANPQPALTQPPPVTGDKYAAPLVTSWLSLAELIAGLIFVLRWFAGQFGLWRLVRASQAPPREVRQQFQSMTASCPLRPRLLMSSRVRSPLSFGLFRPTVLLPAALCQSADHQTLRYVFAHELTHLRRGDPWSCSLFSLASAVFFYLPWFWLLRRTARLCQEYIADAAAARDTSWPDEYAQFLLSLNGRPKVPAGAFGVFGNTSDLFRRIRMLLQPSERVDDRCPRSWALLALGGLTALAIVLGGLGFTSRAAALSAQPDVTKQPQSATTPPATPTAPVQPPVPTAPVQPPGGFPGFGQPNLPQPVAPPPGIGGGFGYGFGYGSRLGVRLQQPSDALVDQLDLPKGQGLVISGVRAGSAAQKAGFKNHDILLTLNGKEVPSNPWQLNTTLRDIKPDQKIDVVVLRKGKKKTLKGITLPEQRFGIMPPGGVPGMPPAVPGFAARAGAFPGVNPPTPRIPPGFPSGFTRSVTAAATATNSNGVMTTLFKSNDHFTARHQEGSLVISVIGKTHDGKADVSEITVQDGTATHTYRNLAKVPERYRDKVKNLVDLSAGNNAKIEVESPRRRSARPEGEEKK